MRSSATPSPTTSAASRWREALYRGTGAVTVQYSIAEIAADLKQAGIPNAQISDIPKVLELEQLRAKLTTTMQPSGRTVRMQPIAVDAPGANTSLHFPHKYGADTRAVLAEAGMASEEINALAKGGVIAG